MNKITEFIQEFNHCPICGGKLRLVMSFEEQPFYSALIGVDDRVLFLPEISTKKARLSYSYFEYDLTNHSFIFKDANMKMILSSYDFYIYYICDVIHKRPAAEMLCYYVSSNIFSLSNYKSNIKKHTHESPEHYNNNIWRQNLFSIVDGNNTYTILSDFDSQMTSISQVNSNASHISKCCDIRYAKSRFNLANISDVKAKLRRIALF